MQLIHCLFFFFQIQLLLTEYLDMKNTEKSRQQVPSSFEEANIDIGTFFVRKKPQKAKKVWNKLLLFISEFVYFW